MLTSNKTLTVGDLMDACASMPRHTPVTIKARIRGPIDEDELYGWGVERASYSGNLAVKAARYGINCVELEARA